MRCIGSKRSNVMMWMEPNEELQIYVIKFIWEVIHAYFYNWDGLPFLVLIVYNLVELIIEVSHQIKDYLIFGTHTHHTCLCSMNALFICDCTWLNMLHMLNYMLIKHKNIFECFSCFWKVFLFWKISKISKTMQPCFADLPHGSSQLRAPNRELT